MFGWGGHKKSRPKAAQIKYKQILKPLVYEPVVGEVQDETVEVARELEQIDKLVHPPQFGAV